MSLADSGDALQGLVVEDNGQLHTFIFNIIITLMIIIKPANPNIESAIHNALIDRPLTRLIFARNLNPHLK